MTTTSAIPNIGTGQSTNPLKGLLAYGQSPWMDYIRRDLLTSGELKKYIDNDGLRGMTSNPAIFEKAITGSNLYADILSSPEAKKLMERIARQRNDQQAAGNRPDHRCHRRPVFTRL